MNGPNRYIGSEYPLLFMDPEKEDAKGEGNKFRNDTINIYGTSI